MSTDDTPKPHFLEVTDDERARIAKERAEAAAPTMSQQLNQIREEQERRQREWEAKNKIRSEAESAIQSLSAFLHPWSDSCSAVATEARISSHDPAVDVYKDGWEANIPIPDLEELTLRLCAVGAALLTTGDSEFIDTIAGDGPQFEMARLLVRDAIHAGPEAVRKQLDELFAPDQWKNRPLVRDILTFKLIHPNGVIPKLTAARFGEPSAPLNTTAMPVELKAETLAVGDVSLAAEPFHVMGLEEVRQFGERVKAVHGRLAKAIAAIRQTPATSKAWLDNLQRPGLMLGDCLKLGPPTRGSILRELADVNEANLIGVKCLDGERKTAHQTVLAVAEFIGIEFQKCRDWECSRISEETRLAEIGELCRKLADINVEGLTERLDAEAVALTRLLAKPVEMQVRPQSVSTHVISSGTAPSVVTVPPAALAGGAKPGEPNSPAPAAPKDLGTPGDVRQPVAEGKLPDYVFGYADILTTIGVKPIDKSNKGRVKRLNEKHNGPIIIGDSSPPKAERVKLIEWWRGMEAMWQSQQDSQANKAATVAEQYQHGRDATVVPGIDGHVKKNRAKKSKS